MYVLCKIASLLLLATIVSGGQLYNSSQICCDGAVYDYNYSDELFIECCGNKLLTYPRSLEDDEDSIIPLCCNDVLHEKPKNKNFLCCGTELYDEQVKTCFNYSNIIQIPSKNLEKNETEVCDINGDIISFYNPKEKLCCSGQLLENKKDFSCCGAVSYNSSTSLCCQPNQVTEVGNATNKFCCEDKIYDSTEATCCYESIKLENGMYESVGVVVYYHGKYSQHYSSCCGSTVYNYMEEQCCTNGPIAKPDPTESYTCCGAGLMTWDQLCVAGNGQDKTESDQDVCGDSIVYRTSEHFCYNNTLIKHGEDEELCYGNGKLYDRTTQICRGDSIINLNPEEIKDNIMYYRYCEEDKPNIY